MYSQILLTTAVRGSGLEPTTSARAADGVISFMNAAFGLRFPPAAAAVFLAAGAFLAAAGAFLAAVVVFLAAILFGSPAPGSSVLGALYSVFNTLSQRALSKPEA